jgi:hypothetical protein
VLDMTHSEPAPADGAEAEVKRPEEEADETPEPRRSAEVDRVALTREFAQLFDMEGRDES